MAVFFLQLLAEFLSIIQILVYAGAILVIFIFALVLFQDAYQSIEKTKGKSCPVQIGIAICILFVPIGYFFWKIQGIDSVAIAAEKLPSHFGKVANIGEVLSPWDFTLLKRLSSFFSSPCWALCT